MKALEAPKFFNRTQKIRKDKLTKTRKPSALCPGFSDTYAFL
jgi:hypothetical protein